MEKVPEKSPFPGGWGHGAQGGDLMMMFNNGLRRLPAVRLGLIILWLLAWSGAGLAADSAPLPAQAWNLRQVERLETAGEGALTFAVLGDSRSNAAVFAQVLKALAGDPGLAFAIEVGDMVEQGTLNNSRRSSNKSGQPSTSRFSRW